jgi:DNA topoisomerase-1
MPAFLVPLHEFNQCHLPGGNPEGGQFCGTGAWARGQSRMTSSRRATTSPMHPATDKERKRLVIPPAYIHVMVADDPKAELRATAVSPVTGETAYFHVARYKARQQGAKWSRVVHVQQHIETLNAKLDKAIAKGKGEDYHTAMTVRLILQTGLRNGTEPDGETVGASSMRMEHVTVEGDTVRFAFPGKGAFKVTLAEEQQGKLHTLEVHDPVLAKYVRARQTAGAETLFPHEGADTLAYLKRVGGKIKVHDLRTWYATVYADHLVTEMIKTGLAPKTPKEQKAFRKQVATTVANRLGNTPGMTLKTYIHPKVWEAIGWEG